jgi:hypothetical protein
MNERLRWVDMRVCRDELECTLKPCRSEQLVQVTYFCSGTCPRAHSCRRFPVQIIQLLDLSMSVVAPGRVEEHDVRCGALPTFRH